MGGGRGNDGDSIWGGETRHIFLLTLGNSKNIGGGGARAPPPFPRSLNNLAIEIWNAPT